MAYAQRSNMGGHPDHGLSGVAGQHEAGTGMESAYGGQAIGVYGGMAAGENEMGAFLDAMQERYGLESVTNFIDNYLNKYLDEVAFPNPPAGFRDFNYDSQTTPLDRQARVNPEEENSPQSQMSRVPFGDLGLSYPAAGNMFDALDAAQANTQNFTAYDQGFIDQMMESNNNNVGPEYGGGGDYWINRRAPGSFGDQ